MTNSISPIAAVKLLREELQAIVDGCYPSAVCQKAREALRLTASIEQPEWGASAGITPEYKAAQKAKNVAASAMLDVVAGAPVDERVTLISDALDIAFDLVNAEASHIHETYKGYKPHKHAAIDADVATVNAARAALQQPGLADKVPEGWKLVPVEPTEEMAEIGMEHTADPCWIENVKSAYRAMLAAAPLPPEKQ